MATDLPFKRVMPRTAHRLPVPTGGAAIIIFPGVRYEREDSGGGGKDASCGLRQERKGRTKR